MNNIKITDFTKDELKVIYTAVGMRLAMEIPETERDILERFNTQVVYAGALNKVKENIADN